MPILQEILIDHWKSTNNATSTAQPGQHQNIHNDVNDIPPHPTPPQPNSPHPAWVEQIHLHAINPLLQPDSASLTDGTRRKGPCQANGGGGVAKVKGHAEWGTPTPTSTAPVSKALLQMRHQS